MKHKMAWNEPGGPKDEDPWGSRKSEQGPPDLDDIVKRLQETLGRFFGGGRKGGKGSGTAQPGTFKIGMLVLIALVIWGLSGLYIVDQGKRGVVLRFGMYQTTTQAGLHWHLPYPIERVMVVNVEQIRNVEVGYRSGGSNQPARPILREALMLTQDENIIDIKFAIQYKVKNARDYLFNVRDPDVTLHQATESAVREVIGKNKMDFALTEGRSEIAARAGRLIQEILDRYNSGLQVTSVNMQDAQPPEQVQGAFSDAVKAREDEQRLKNEAEAYANDILPKARGAAARLMQEAQAYKSRVVDRAEGETSRFSQVLTEYEKAPEVTRERLYLDAIEAVLGRTSKVMVDVKGGNSLLYLPLDRLLQSPRGALPMISPTAPQMAPPAQPAPAPAAGSRGGGGSFPANLDERSRKTLRRREVR